MNIGLVVNADGKMCLVHDESFDSPPLFVGYHLDALKIEIFFASGTRYPIAWEATPEMDDYLQKINKILIIRMEEKRPVEGYDTSLFHFKNGKAIELDGPPDEDSQTTEHVSASLSGLHSVNDRNFEAKVLLAQKPVLVVFMTEWSGPAAEATPILEELSAELGDQIYIVVIDAEDNATTAAKYDIRTIPALTLFVSGELVDNWAGAIVKIDLQKWLLGRI